MFKQQLTKIILQTLKEFEIQGNVSVEATVDHNNGHYATNVAMIYSKQKGESPLAFAEKLVNNLENKEISFVEKITIAKPGFINFWIQDTALIDSIDNKNYTLASEYRGKKIMVEYTDPNPFKELHIGHLYSNIIGESLCRMFEYVGAEVCRVDYYGDVGMHVAKSLWGLKQLLQREKITIDDLEKQPLDKRVKFLGEGYALGSNAFADDQSIGDAIKQINKAIYIIAQRDWNQKGKSSTQVDYLQGDIISENELKEIELLYLKGRAWSLEYFEVLYKRLGTSFDKYYPESIASEWGYSIVKNNLENGVFIKSEGAIIFPGEKFGLHNRVFINKLGLPTYEAKELGLMPWKYEDFPYDYSFIVTATEIAGYFSVLKMAMSQVNPELAQKTTPVLHGMVKLPEGKMSSRSGNVISVNDLLDEAKNRILPRVSETILERDEVAEMVGVAAVKYAFLKSTIGKDIVFNFDESVSFEGNSGPYIQYTYARTQSVLRKIDNSEEVIQSTFKLCLEEREVLLLLTQFEERVNEAVAKLSPNTIISYLFLLAQSFNAFYQKCSILKAEAEEKKFRLLLTRQTGIIISKGLYLLGITSPEKM